MVPCEESACPAVPAVAPGVTVALPIKATEKQVGGNGWDGGDGCSATAVVVALAVVASMR